MHRLLLLDYDGLLYSGEPKQRDSSWMPWLVEALRPWSDVRIVVAGTIWTREEAEQQLELGADAIALGRAAIVNPAWPELIRRGEEPARSPRTPAQLEAAGLSPKFVGYMRNWKNFVLDEPTAEGSASSGPG